MDKVHRAMPDVPQNVADQACDILERYFSRYGVTRAMHLPEQARLELVQELRAFYSVELPFSWVETALAQRSSWWQRAWRRFVSAIRVM